MKFGKRLQRERERRGLTQRELGLKVGLTSGTYISQIESGEKIPPLETAIKLANALGLEDAVPFVFHAVRERSAVEYGFLSSRIKPFSPGKSEPCPRPLPVCPWASVVEGNLPTGIEGSSADARCIVLEGLGDADCFTIKISTDWMADAVRRGDVVVVSPGREVVSGDIALVKVRGKRGTNVEEIKIARAYFRGRWTDLVPGNLSRYPVETYPSHDITFLGKVVARLGHLLRHLPVRLPRAAFVSSGFRVIDSRRATRCRRGCHGNRWPCGPGQGTLCSYKLPRNTNPQSRERRLYDAFRCCPGSYDSLHGGW